MRARSTRVRGGLRAGIVLAVVGACGIGIWLLVRGPSTADDVRASAQPSAVRETSGASKNSLVEERASADPARSAVTTATDESPVQEASPSTEHSSASIRGRVLETWDAPIADMRVWLVRAIAESEGRYLTSVEQPGRSCTTNARGEFEFTSLDLGAWLVGPAPAGSIAATPDERSVAPMSILVILRADEDTPPIVLRAHRGLVLKGHVRRPDGTPASRAYVSARSPDAPGLRLAPTRPGGEFTLGPLVPAQYELWADADEEGTTSATVLAFAGDDRIVLRLREGGRLLGRITASGAHGRVTVVAMRQDIEPREMLRLETDVGRGFQFDNVAPGSYQVIAQSSDAWFATRSRVHVVGDRETPLDELELLRGGWLRIEHSSSDPVRVELRQEDVVLVADELRERSQRLSVPAGRIRVRWAVGARPSRDELVECAPGQETSLALAE